MESRLGVDFSGVRIHVNSEAADSARSIGAKAYTVGSDIVFGAGRYDVKSPEGRKLLAHELTHVVQQAGAGPTAQVIHKAADVEPLAKSQNGAAGGAGARLGEIIAQVESVRSEAGKKLAGTKTADVGALEESKKYVDGLGTLLEHLRAVQSGADDAAKQHAVDAFAPAKLDEAKMHLGSRAATSQAPVGIHESTDVDVAAAFLEVSDPQSPAEVEAARVSEAVCSGRATVIEQVARRGVAYRQAGAAVLMAGNSILAFEAAGPGEAEAAVPGPGWIALGATLLVAGVLIGAGTLMMSRNKDRTRTAERAEPTTGTPTPPPPDLCRTAIKILTQYERLAQKFGLNLPESRIAELNRLRDAGQITINHIPARLREQFPTGTFADMTLAAIRALCGM
jgi:hypothetical protein